MGEEVDKNKAETLKIGKANWLKRGRKNLKRASKLDKNWNENLKWGRKLEGNYEMGKKMGENGDESQHNSSLRDLDT